MLLYIYIEKALILASELIRPWGAGELGVLAHSQHQKKSPPALFEFQHKPEGLGGVRLDPHAPPAYFLLAGLLSAPPADFSLFHVLRLDFGLGLGRLEPELVVIRRQVGGPRRRHPGETLHLKEAAQQCTQRTGEKKIFKKKK